ncbi:MAG TPA: zf-HC2 domain-containing protein [Ilumatobacteraceae bacterium]|nr:zf-HC2 domain-containing protein [Ilumatobacteraceae bacterium]
MIRAWRRHRRKLVCRDAVMLLSDYLDGHLDQSERARLEAHLADCDACEEFLAQLRMTIDALGHTAPDDLTDESVQEFVELYHRWRAD